MSFIQFANAREKNTARENLKEARDHMLNEAKKMAEQRAEAQVKRMLKGETNLMLPSVSNKVQKKIKEHKKSKRRKEKKIKKKTHKRKRSTSDFESESSDSDSTTDTTNRSPSDNDRSPKKRKKSKKKNKSGSKIKETRSCDTDSDDTDDEKHCLTNLKKSKDPLKRDSWMTGSLMLKTYSKDRVENKSNEKPHLDNYDPVKSSRELNPYWKTTGIGLPIFQKPKDEEENKSAKSVNTVFSQRAFGTKGWRKQCDKKKSELIQSEKQTSGISQNDESSPSDNEHIKGAIAKPTVSTLEFLTDQQMNELGAKIVKAEIMGNIAFANELREKLEKARTQRNIFKEGHKTAYRETIHNSNKSKNDKCSTNAEYILLTQTDQADNTRPLPASKIIDSKHLDDGKKKQRIASHDESGKRVRYFADDDRYDIKQMFEVEKYTSASDANSQFANIAAKHKNTKDDLEDIFEDKIYQNVTLRSDRSKFIHEHKKNEMVLDNCDKCFDSTKMRKELLICVGANVHLALPWYRGLQPGHCMIIPNQHASCCTHIDEDTWSEINEFRKALTRMFAVQDKDVIFFEIANKLRKRPHLAVHCIPIRKSDGEMAPFYFKKAIEESEHEWCVNKQLVSLRTKSLRSSIPKGLPYFWVNFGMDTGFAHVIEDEERFPANFAQEIIGGMLHLDTHKWRRLEKDQNIITKVKMFADLWKKYDCTL